MAWGTAMARCCTCSSAPSWRRRMPAMPSSPSTTSAPELSLHVAPPVRPCNYLQGGFSMPSTRGCGHEVWWPKPLRLQGKIKLCHKQRVYGRQVKDAIPLSLGPVQAAVSNLRGQPWAAGIPSADGLITR